MNLLKKQYQDYLELITGKVDIEKSPLASMVYPRGKNPLQVYQTDYLKDQILHWGGVIEELFPKTCGMLKEEGVLLDEFVSFFYKTPGPVGLPYDYFKIKLDRFKASVFETGQRFSPPKKERLLSAVEQEVREMLAAYTSFNPAD
ncbi:MAG: hypothetical protein ACYDBV_06835 [Nitrospiria bacterium]